MALERHGLLAWRDRVELLVVAMEGGEIQDRPQDWGRGIGGMRAHHRRPLLSDRRRA